MLLCYAMKCFFSPPLFLPVMIFIDEEKKTVLKVVLSFETMNQTNTIVISNHLLTLHIYPSNSREK